MAAKKKKPKKNVTDNLRSWKPGQSGNPNGRPKGTLSITTQVKKVGEWEAPKELVKEYQQLCPQLPDNASWAQTLAVKMWVKALDQKSGDAMAKEIVERIDGKVPLSIGGTPNGHPIAIKHDLSGLSDKELSLMDRILKKVESPDE